MAATSSSEGGSSRRRSSSPMAQTREQSRMPKRERSWRARAPRATVAAVERALAFALWTGQVAPEAAMAAALRAAGGGAR